MIEDLTPAPRSSRRRWTVVLVLTLGYLALRLLNLWELWLASSAQSASGPPNPDGNPSEYFVDVATPASPGLAGVLANWDGQWYERIATQGYASLDEPHSANDAWTWAFPPLFPLLVRAVMTLTGLGFPVAALALNLVLGGAATALLYAILRLRLAVPLAIAGALSMNTFVSAPLFVLAYSEPTALVFVLLTLWFTIKRRYLGALVCTVLLAFTRPVAIPLAAVFAVHWLMLRRSHSRNEVRRGSQVLLATCTLVSLVSPWIWNGIAALLSSQAGTGAQEGPLSGTARASSMIQVFDFGWIGGMWRASGATGVLVVLLPLGAVLGGAVVAARRLRYPVEMLVWGVAYIAFVVLVTPPTPGLLRYLLLAAPLLVALQVVPLTWRHRVVGVAAVTAITGAALWSQWLWIRYLYILDPAPALLPWPP